MMPNGSVRKVLDREPIRVPAWDELPETVKHELAAASQGLTDLRPLAADAIRGAPDRVFADLTHRLSDAYVQLNPQRENIGRSGAEQEALAWFEMQLAEADLSSERAFRGLLERLNARLTGGRSVWRKRDIFLNADKAGTRIRLPAAAHVPSQLRRLRKVCLDDGLSPGLFRATAALALTVNAHPFTDGNGRVGRILFNHVLREAGLTSNAYVPLYEMAMRSRGGYEIALRLAEIHGDWVALVRFMISLVTLCPGMARAA